VFRRRVCWPAALEEMLGKNFTGEINLSIPEPLIPSPPSPNASAARNHSGKELSQLVQHSTATHTHTQSHLQTS